MGSLNGVARGTADAASGDGGRGPVVAVHDRAASPRAMIALYLAAIVAANLLVARFGPRAAFAVAFAFIGLDLTVRDRLHEAWMRRGLVWKMSLLIASGSVISWVLNRSSERVALASFVAFAAASICDALSFHLLRERRYVVKVNGSNVFGALADSIVFPTIAFGGFALAITAGQFVSKVAGGFVWSLLIGAPRPEPGLPPATADG